MNPTTDLTPARKLLAAGFKLCLLKHHDKAPVGTGWQKRPVKEINDAATGYGLILALNGLASLDPDDVERARGALKAVGFDLDELMQAGVQTSSTRPGSGGRSAFKAQAGLEWYAFRIRLKGKKRKNHIVFECRASGTNLQDTIPGCVYKHRGLEGLFTQQYVGKRTLDKPPALPAEFAAWWKRMSSDIKFRDAQEAIMAKAIGEKLVPNRAMYKQGRMMTSGVALAHPSPKRGDFNLMHRVEDILERHGYEREGSRYRAPGAGGSAGVLLIPGKKDLWQSHHGSDPLQGTFDAWTAFVTLDHDNDVKKAEAALKRNGKSHEPPQEVDPEAPIEKDKLPTEFDIDDLDTMAIPPALWVVDGLIRPGLTLLAAPPKQGKSYLVLQMCMYVTAGVPFLGRQTSAVQTVYYDLEEWHELLKARVAPIRAGAKLIGKKLPLLKVKMKTGVGDEAIEDMAGEIAKGAKLLVVDLLARVRDEMGEDAKKNIYARDYAFIAKLADFALDNPGVAIVVVHHANKGQHDNWQDKISGSAGLTGATHTNIYLARPDLRGMDDADKEEALRYRVMHAVGKGVKDQEIALEMMADGGGWQVAPYKPWEIGTTLKQRNVLLVLNEDPARWWSAKEVAARLGLAAKNVALMLFRLMKEGTIESDGRGGGGYRLLRKS